jgi:hypothetical protein
MTGPFPPDTIEFYVPMPAVIEFDAGETSPATVEFTEDIGPRGATGAQGPQGGTGPAGSQGAQGAIGPQGFDGAPGIGARGPMGPQGATGATGDTGAQGSQGGPGSGGAQGAQGAPGAVGTQGPQGPAGSVGPQGAAGAQGPQGSAGTNGSAGAQGAQGAQGPQGAAGSAGSVGSQGPQGATGPTLTDRGDWVTATSYAVGDLVSYSNGRFQCITANSDATFTVSKWNVLSNPTVVIESSDTDPRYFTTAPQPTPIKTATFTPLSSQVMFRAKMQAQVYGAAPTQNTVYIGPASLGRRPRPTYQGETVPTGVKSFTFGISPDTNLVNNDQGPGSPFTYGFSQPGGRTRNLTGLTSGSAYNLDFTTSIVGIADNPAVSNTPTDIAVARSQDGQGHLVLAACCTGDNTLKLVEVWDGLGPWFASYLVRSVALPAAPVAVATTPDDSKFVVVCTTGTTYRMVVVNVSDGSIANTITLPFAPLAVQCATSAYAYVVLNTAPGLYLQSYNLSTGAAGSGGLSLTSSAVTIKPGQFRIPPTNPLVVGIAGVGNTVLVCFIASDTTTPVLSYTMTNNEPVLAFDFNYDVSRTICFGASGLVNEYVTGTTSTVNRALQIKDDDRATSRPRAWIKALRSPGSVDACVIAVCSDAASSPASTHGYHVYQVDLTQTALQQFIQWDTVGIPNTNTGAPATGFCVSDDGGLFFAVGSQGCVNYYEGAEFQLYPGYYLNNDSYSIEISPAVP